MMGKSHAASGAAVWLVGCAAASVCGWHPSMAAVVVGSGVCAGWALAPDLDHPGSAVARSAGPATRMIARGVARLGVFVHARTKTGADRPDRDGHRTVTHTLAWALLWGGLAAAGQLGSGLNAGPWVAAGLVFFATVVGVKAAVPPQYRIWKVHRHRRTRSGRLVRAGRPTRVRVPLAVAAVLAFAAYRMTPQQGWWLGLAVFVGSLTHCLGDALTNSGCPLLWPIRIRGRAWYPVGPPPQWRFDTNGWVETKLVHPLLAVACVLALLVMVLPAAGAAAGDGVWQPNKPYKPVQTSAPE